MESTSYKPAISSQYLEDHIEHIEKIYQEDKIIESFSYFKFLEEGVFSGDITFKSIDEEKSDYENFLAFPVLTKVNYDSNLYYRCIETYKNCFSKPPSKILDDAKLWWINEEDTKSLTAVGSVDINASLLKCLYLLGDQQSTLKTYDSFESISTLKSITSKRNISSTVVKLPSPFDKRQVLSYSVWFKDGDSAVLMYKSVGEDSRLFDFKDNRGSNIQEIKVNFGFYLFKPISEKKTNMICGSNIEYNLTGVPDLIMNNIIKEISIRGVSMNKSLMEDPENDKILEQNSEGSKDFYSIFT